MKLLIASRNRHKIEEIKAIFQAPGLEWVGAGDVPGLPDVVEDGATFQSNAVKKAMTLALASHLWTLADDSGLEVDALGGAPGVRSARYAGEPANDAANNARLLRELGERPDRTARFCCVIALCSPAGRAQTVEGACAGRILTEARGLKGFGYDPLFVPDRHEQTFAELEVATKNKISHRARALQQARAAWGDILAGNPSDWPRRDLSFSARTKISLN